jgi:hypothetical protein
MSAAQLSSTATNIFVVEKTFFLCTVNVNASTSHGKETHDDVPGNFHVAEQVQKDIGAAVHAGVV